MRYFNILNHFITTCTRRKICVKLNTLISFPSCQCACLHTSTTNIIYHNWHIDNHTKKLADSHVKSKKYTVQKAIKGSEGNVILSRNEILTLCTILDIYSTLLLSNRFACDIYEIITSVVL